MVKVGSPTPIFPQPVVNGVHPAPPSSFPTNAPTAVMYSNPAVDAELPEVNEPAKPFSDGETNLLRNKNLVSSTELLTTVQGL